MSTATPPVRHAYLLDRGFVLQATQYEVDRRHNPYHRPSLTLIVGEGGRFELGANGEPIAQHDAALLPPNIRRDWIAYRGPRMTIIDVGIDHAAFLRLLPYARPGVVRVPDAATVQRLRDVLARFPGDVLAADAPARLFDAVLDAVCHPPCPPAVRDPRVQQVMARIQGLTLGQLENIEFSAEVGLSPSRLRALFLREAGCSMSQYLRWVAGWRAAQMWREGRSFTEVAHAAGFYDLAHADRVLNELFGFNPTLLTDPRSIALHANAG